jgi:pyridoxine 4-dehydrogenase
MQLAGRDGNKVVWGPPKDIDGAIVVLREAVESGVNHIDTSDYYGPHVTNQIIREALHPYRDGLVIVTKIGAKARHGRIMDSRPLAAGSRRWRS